MESNINWALDIGHREETRETKKRGETRKRLVQ
jgi:hypothetical protein